MKKPISGSVSAAAAPGDGRADEDVLLPGVGGRSTLKAASSVMKSVTPSPRLESALSFGREAAGMA